MILLGAPLLSLILYFFEYFSIYAWIYAWLLMVSFSIIIQPIFNIFIAPMFNKFTPLQEGNLRNMIVEFANSVDFPIKNIDIIDGSRRSSKSNAYFSGIGKRKRIAPTS